MGEGRGGEGRGKGGRGGARREGRVCVKGMDLSQHNFVCVCVCVCVCSHRVELVDEFGRFAEVHVTPPEVS